MKMILPIKAPYDGIVESINCSPGEAVQPGLQLLNIEQLVRLRAITAGNGQLYIDYRFYWKSKSK